MSDFSEKRFKEIYYAKLSYFRSDEWIYLLNKILHENPVAPETSDGVGRNA